jgi:hypothetical protein
MPARLGDALALVAVARSRRPRLPGALKVGATIVIILLVAAALAQYIAPYPFDQMHIRDRFSPPACTIGRALTNMAATYSAAC